MSNRQEKQVFVAGPFTEALVERNSFEKITEDRLKYIISCVSRTKHKWFSSHVRENWGDLLENPKILAQRDLDEMSQCTHVIAYLGTIPTIGTFIEIGMAVPLKKPILVVMDDSFAIRSDFLKGLLELGLIKVVKWTEPDSIEKEIMTFLS